MNEKIETIDGIWGHWGQDKETLTTPHTSRIILDGGQLGTHPNTLRGIEEAGLRG